MSHSFRVLLISFFLPFLCHSQDEEDRKIVIENKVQEFSFSKGSGENPVLITEKYSELYRSNDLQTSVLFSELYNENETIDDVDIKIDKKKAKWITPRNDYYSVENFSIQMPVCVISVCRWLRPVMVK
ncbi:MAG: hypothetical protein WDN26_14670 [Chitinophagaceae bacterium]